MALWEATGPVWFLREASTTPQRPSRAASCPSPPMLIADRHYPCRFQVRTAPDLHRPLALRAAEANVSLNRVVSDQLAKF